MKSPPHLVALIILSAVLTPPRPAAAQSGGPFDLSWSALGSGGSSSGGTFGLKSLVAPGNAGRASGGSFQLEGGWGGVISTIDVPGERPSIPSQFAFLPPRPNPARAGTLIGFELPRPTGVH